MAELVGRMEVKLPWWWRFYLVGAVLASQFGFNVRADDVGAFISGHAKFYLVSSDGRRSEV